MCVQKRFLTDTGRGAENAAYALEEVPRPVLAFLLDGCRLKPHEALAECLRELAEEGLIRYETDAGGIPVIGLGADSPRSGRPLLRFEQVALARVRARAGRVSRVPLSALASDDGDAYQDWARQQEEELGEEARRAGLAVKSAPRGSWRAVLSLDAVAVGAVAAVHAIDYKAGDHIAGPVLLAAAAALLVPLFLRRWRLTPEGARSVSSWRRAGRGVSRPAQGLKDDGGPTAGRGWTSALDGPGGAPLPRGHAWSALGGQWHTVRLGPGLRRPYWSSRPGLGMVLIWTLMGSFYSVLIGLFGFGFDFNGALIAFAPATLAAAGIACLWVPAYTGRMALPDAVAFTGEVVKLSYVEGGDDSPDRHLAWLDDGSPVSMQFDVGPGPYQRLSVGDLVLVNWSPRRRCLNGIEPARPG